MTVTPFITYISISKEAIKKRSAEPFPRLVPKLFLGTKHNSASQVSWRKCVVLIFFH